MSYEQLARFICRRCGKKTYSREKICRKCISKGTKVSQIRIKGKK